jgi:MFS family permease
MAVVRARWHDYRAVEPFGGECRGARPISLWWPWLAGFALTLMLTGGAIGTLVGGHCADRYGRRNVMVWAMVPLVALLALIPIVGLAGSRGPIASPERPQLTHCQRIRRSSYRRWGIQWVSVGGS